MRQDRGADFLAGFATETLVVQGLKYGLGDSELNRRPNGGSHGFPSGHAALAMYGATNLARKCLPDRPFWGALAYGTALAVGLSRVNSDHHEGLQVGAGLAIGYFSNGVAFGITDKSVSIGMNWKF